MSARLAVSSNPKAVRIRRRKPQNKPLYPHFNGNRYDFSCAGLLAGTWRKKFDLHIYRYSPEFSDFALRCIQMVSPSIVLPSTVKFEYLKHYRAYFGDMEKRVRKMDNAAKTEITSASRKVLKICDNLQALRYPDISELREKISDKFEELLTISEDFFIDRTILDFIANPWGGKGFSV